MKVDEFTSLMIAYWFRILLSPILSIHDILPIIIQFADQFEEFDVVLTHRELNIDIENKRISSRSHSHERKSAFGKILILPGRKYHWRIKIIQADDCTVYVGILQANKCKNSLNRYWWTYQYGYSYCNGGVFSNKRLCVVCGESFGTGDVIDIWLDYKESNTLSFGKNYKRFDETFDVEPNIKYKFGVSISKICEIEIVHFEIEY